MLLVPAGSNWWHEAHLLVMAWPLAMSAFGSTVPQSGITSAASPPPPASAATAMAYPGFAGDSFSNTMRVSCCRPKIRSPVASAAPAILLNVKSAMEKSAIPPRVAWASLARYRRPGNRPITRAGRAGTRTPDRRQHVLSMTPIVIIPARMAATRLPGKPLADIGGTPMILRVLAQARLAAVGDVAVAAADPEIVELVRGAGGVAVLTDPALPSGSDRVLAALGELDPDAKCDIVVNLQGDMPFVSPAVITACLGVLAAEADCDIATAIAPEASPADRADPAVVKAIVALGAGEPRGRALYFTRSTLYGEGPIWKHVGIYAYRRHALTAFCAAPPSPLERREKLEQLRALELGLSIWAAVVDEPPISVDTPADLEAARAFARQRP